MAFDTTMPHSEKLVDDILGIGVRYNQLTVQYNGEKMYDKETETAINTTRWQIYQNVLWITASDRFLKEEVKPLENIIFSPDLFEKTRNHYRKAEALLAALGK